MEKYGWNADRIGWIERDHHLLNRGWTMMLCSRGWRMRRRRRRMFHRALRNRTRKKSKGLSVDSCSHRLSTLSSRGKSFQQSAVSVNVWERLVSTIYRDSSTFPGDYLSAKALLDRWFIRFSIRFSIVLENCKFSLLFCFIYKRLRRAYDETPLSFVH